MPAHELTIPSGDVTLEGALLTPDGEGPFPVVVVCHPHPQMGGDMHSNVVAAAVSGLVERGVAAIRFNFRGVGRSGGAHTSGEGEQHDVRAVLAHAAALPDVDPGRVGLAGYSFGAGMAAAVAADGATAGSIDALALIAPPGGAAGHSQGLASFARPTLLMAGEDDQFCPAEALQDLASALGDDAETHVVPRVDHFWLGFEREVSATVGEFFARQLTAPE
jgi:alpha/beta superfamily hydrolase